MSHSQVWSLLAPELCLVLYKQPIVARCIVVGFASALAAVGVANSLR